MVAVVAGDALAVRPMSQVSKGLTMPVSAVQTGRYAPMLSRAGKKRVAGVNRRLEMSVFHCSKVILDARYQCKVTISGSNSSY